MQVTKAFKGKILKGSIYLTVRQLLSAGLSLVSVVVIARVLGPQKYGIAVTGIGILYFLKWTVRLGLNGYLVRKPDLFKDDVEQVLLFYNTVGIAFCVVLWLATPISGWWTGHTEVTQILRCLVPLLWVDMVGGVSMSMLERDLRFDLISLTDMLAQFSNYLISIPVVLIWQSYWGLVAGMALQIIVYTGLASYFYHVSWCWRWRWQALKPALHYGVTYYCSDWFFTLKSLTVPAIVSRLAGIEAVGIINIALRLVQQLSLLREVIRRMSMSVMAKVISDPQTTRRILSRGMAYVGLLMSGVCALFACIAPWLIPELVGKKWLLSVQIFPLLALAASVDALFDLQKATLYAVGHNSAVAYRNAASTGLLWLGCWLFIPWAGLWGYALAELFALPSLFSIHQSLTKVCGSPNYWSAFWIILTAIPSLIGSIWLPLTLRFGVFIISYGILFMLNQNIRALLRELWSTARSSSKEKIVKMPLN